MKSPAPQSPTPVSIKQRKGFALLITITLLAFLVLLLVSLAALTRVETQVASNNQQIAQARQNALMALNLALGQLQKYTGPDQRVTAPADIKVPGSVTIIPTDTGEQVATALNSYWRGSRNRRWTGAWKNVNPTTYDPDNAPAYNPVPGLQSWLVSGNENTPDPADPLAPNADDRFLFKPSDIVTGLTPSSTPNDEIMDANGRPHRLLVKASAGVTNASSLDRAVTAPQVPIMAANVPGQGSAPVPVGHYAWWVGDEGVKARANLIDPYAGETSAEAIHRRRQTAQRPAIEAMTAALANTYPANDERIPNVATASQFSFIDTDPAYRTEIKDRFHDLSTCSRGVLADVKNGGLKRDLTYVLSRPDLNAFRTALTTVSADAPPYNVAPLGTSNPVFSTIATPYAAYPTMPANPNNTSYGGPLGIFPFGPTWEQVWSFYNLGNVSPLGIYDASGVAQSRQQTETQHGLYPIIIQAKAFYRLRVIGNQVWLSVSPVAVLANPYNVPLSGSFILQLRNNPQIRAGTPADPDNPLASEFTNYGSISRNAGLYDIRLVIQADGIPPGRAQVFSIDPNHTESEITIPSVTDRRRVRMVSGFHPETFVTFNTAKIIPTPTAPPATPRTHAVLWSGGSLQAMLFGDDQSLTDPYIVSNRITTTVAISPTGETGGFLVYPVTTGGSRQGGGVAFSYFDAFFPRLQHAIHYQANYRGLRVDYTGASAHNSHPNPLARGYYYLGNTVVDSSAPDPQPNPFLAANLLPDTDDTFIRWGVVNSGGGSTFTVTPSEIGGEPSRTGFINLLYDLPLPGRAITSIAQLQHFNAAGHYNPNFDATPGNDRWTTMVHQFQTNYPIGNSYPNPRTRRDRVLDWQSQYSYTFDGSYLWNDIFWDRFHFSSFPQTGSFDFSAENLINSRYRPFRDQTMTAWNNPAAYRGLYLTAENLLVQGAFNINSTSVEAWKAVFSSLRDVPVSTNADAADLNAPFSRILNPDPIGRVTDAMTGLSANAWQGFRNLTQTEVQRLSEEMVLQVRLRGPFLSMAEFVNRRLAPGRATSASANLDPFGFGLRGALQAAIDKVFNLASDVTSAPFNEQSQENSPHGPQLADADYRMSTRIAGFPGYLLQADLLSPLAPNLAARSDTFTIRTYGDAVNPATSAVEGRAWCEAVVQRTPDYVLPGAQGGNEPGDVATGTNATFGRRYQVVSFRWLSPEDI